MKDIRANSCTDAWLQAISHLRKQTEWRDYNLIFEISSPMALSKNERLISNELNRFLLESDKYPVSTVINTIFPASIYARFGAKELFKRYNNVKEGLAKCPEWKWGTYFARMTSKTDPNGEEINPLEYLIAKLRRQAEVRAPKRAVYELNMLDTALDMPIYDATIDRAYHMGGPCLSHISFKLKDDRSLILTAVYRSHYYIERALGNFYGLAMLQDFVAKAAGVKPAEMVCLSTMAIIDTDGVKKSDVIKMLDSCTGLAGLT